MRSGFGLAALTALGLLLSPASAGASPPSLDRGLVEGPAASVLAAPAPTLGTIGLLAPPVYAKRSRDRTFDTSMGEVDPRKRQLPRTHRFRLAIHSQHVRLTRTLDSETDEYVRFHYAPLMLDVAYQAQFLKYAMVRLAVAAGGNVANTRNAMPGVLFPQAYVGVQTRILGIAFGYGFDWTIPPIADATAPGKSLQQPVITRNHVVMGEVSATTKIDRVALTFSLALGGVKSQLHHYQTDNSRFRFYIGLQAGVFFDGTIRREKRARKAAAGRR
ncbi:hypothetical protein ACNOYE_28020 [Nannocystaceae bacterium ST9]